MWAGGRVKVCIHMFFYKPACWEEMSLAQFGQQESSAHPSGDVLRDSRPSLQIGIQTAGTHSRKIKPATKSLETTRRNMEALVWVSVWAVNQGDTTHLLAKLAKQMTFASWGERLKWKNHQQV